MLIFFSFFARTAHHAMGTFTRNTLSPLKQLQFTPNLFQMIANVIMQHFMPVSSVVVEISAVEFCSYFSLFWHARPIMQQNNPADCGCLSTMPPAFLFATDTSFCNYTTDTDTTGLQHQGRRCPLIALPPTACTKTTQLTVAVYDAASFSICSSTTNCCKTTMLTAAGCLQCH